MVWGKSKVRSMRQRTKGIKSGICLGKGNKTGRRGRNFGSANTRPDIFAVCSAQRQHEAHWEVCVYHFPLLEAAQTVTCLPPSHNISIGSKNAPTPVIWLSSDNEVATNPFSNFHLYKSLSADWGVEHSSSSSTERKTG